MASNFVHTTPTRAPHHRMNGFVKSQTPPTTDNASPVAPPQRPIVSPPKSPSFGHSTQTQMNASNRDTPSRNNSGFDIRRPNVATSRNTATRPVVAPALRAANGGTTLAGRLNGPSSRPKHNMQSSANVKPPQHKHTGSDQSHTAINMRPRWLNDAEAKFKLQGVPRHWDTLQIHKELLLLGDITYIDIPQGDDKSVYVAFKPPPQDNLAIQRGLRVPSQPAADERIYNVYFQHVPPSNTGSSSRDRSKIITVNATHIDFGLMKSEDTMLGLHTTRATPSGCVEVSVDTNRSCVEIQFSIPSSLLTYDKKTCLLPRELRYKMQINFAQLPSIVQLQNHETRETAIFLCVEAPPLVYRREDDISKTHDEGATRWMERNKWFRQTEIEQNLEIAKHAVKQLQRDNPIIDIGRWLSYRLVLDARTSSSEDFKVFHEALEAHGIPLITDRMIKMQFASKAMSMWSWLDNAIPIVEASEDLSSLSDLQQMAHQTIQLPFEVRYQLESCISHGCIHECNVDEEFLEKLSVMATESEHGKMRAIKLLEKVVDEGRRFYDPKLIFKTVVPNMRNAFKQRQHATHFVNVYTATVTPTSIHFNPPSLEPSNRVIRHYRHHKDRFLRVRFVDEAYKGKIYGSEDLQDLEIYTRVKRTMTNGIKVADRTYEFLAFGNSQFRENGAYFFAPIGGLNAQKIRDWMGDFTHIRVVAKYCARVGQSLSTTRPTHNKSVKEDKISDIIRNGYCFTDGVGKISVLLATLITNEVGMLAFNRGVGNGKDYASAFQFRMGGKKGVLVVDPTMGPDLRVAIRPSQEKFDMAKHTGLEICRLSQFTNASLNVQIILVLSALGIEDGVFRAKMRSMLSDLELAMTDESKAIQLLQKNIDANQMTVQIAQMILDGFMERQDPFMISCLRLWRSWSLKYLKEKQRIFVEKGAFVLGCVDETATLEGHYDDKPNQLPQIFLQIPDQEQDGRYKVVEGECMLARNPSLHPGDVRIVQAVRCEGLMHIRDCVVLPQKGDHDIANMCSGGDLDGDDYLIIWDQQLLPKEKNHPPMDYTAPAPVEAQGKIKVKDMIDMYVTHMRYNNVGRIATLHRCWADRSPQGVKSDQCLELAALHSMAVDYAKTGEPAKLKKNLQMSQRPHWYESAKNKYKSEKIIGQLYDMVKKVDFVPVWNLPFDTRILEAFQLDNEVLEKARDVKEQYDEAVRRLMSKYKIQSEFEVWSTFVLKQHAEYNEYKFTEKIGEEVVALKEGFRKLCHQQISADEKEQRDWAMKAPFVAAMYAITAREIEAALVESEKTKMVGGKEVPIMERTFQTMPLMSFPWLFPTELRLIANKRTGYSSLAPMRVAGSQQIQQAAKQKLQRELLGEVAEPAPLREIRLVGRAESDEEKERLLQVEYTGPRMSFARPAQAASALEELELDDIVKDMETSDVAAVASDWDGGSTASALPRRDSVPDLPVDGLLSVPQSPGVPAAKTVGYDNALISIRESTTPGLQALGNHTSLGSAATTTDEDEAGHGEDAIGSLQAREMPTASPSAKDEESGDEESRDEGVEEVVLQIPAKKSAWDALEDLLAW